MSVPTNCISCGMELFTNPPIKEIKCDKCEEIERLQGFIETLQVVHFTELQREKATVERYKKVLQEIVGFSKYEGNQWYENAKKALKD